MSQAVIIAAKIFLQIVLIFIMLFCVFGYAASFEYPSINRYQVIYTLLLSVFSYFFYKLATLKPHKSISTYLVALVFLIWVIVLIREILY